MNLLIRLRICCRDIKSAGCLFFPGRDDIGFSFSFSQLFFSF
jgi:hypothetical protein